MLSQSHPTYLSQLRLTAVKTKFGQDKAVMSLTTISIAVLCVQILIGMLIFFIHDAMHHLIVSLAGVVSTNVTVPTNVKDPSGRYDAFGIVVTLVFLMLGVYLWFVRRWWLQAKAKRRRSAVL
jgi:magnesium transporter